MAPNGIPLDTAAIVSTILEGIFYGFSVLMFTFTIWIMTHRRKRREVNRVMVAVACFLLLFSTAHIVINIIRLEEGLVQYSKTFPGGPLGYFFDTKQWSFVYNDLIYILQTMLGDGVVIFRCYVVWQSWYVIAVPMFMWCSMVATGIGCVYSLSRSSSQEVIFAQQTEPWVTAFFVATLITNFSSTFLLAYRIWIVDRSSAQFRSQGSSPWPLARIIMDSGILYSISLLAALLCFVTQSRGQYIILEMLPPIISIAFYGVIIRATMPTSDRAGQSQSTMRFSPGISRTDWDEREYTSGCMEVESNEVETNRKHSSGGGVISIREL
ncbi:hypothetical protein SERLA73DRAFT_138778 [Serpula lacrymans var. lacrymans S7.3]|uniref:Uncharacterized protein n=2 Tax=Serpula lacrymans var. lacrymans TaxID=341189 RepID=F8PZQ7_SERL3|nr:hypothetical protein SERLA73DRAFT_138778 [Serpula lacrymans var. lacrymans S7.3]